eukprot:scaffold29.g5926.t1
MDEAASVASELQESQEGAADSANYAQTSPRIPRSQVSRAAHAAAQFGGLVEGTSAVLSGLSADDETALSAAEAAGEHTSQPPPLMVQQVQAQQAAAQQAAAPVAAAGKHSNEPGAEEAAYSPPPTGSASPVYRATSLVSHTAAPVLKVRRLHGETPMSAPLVGTSPSTSKAAEVPLSAVPQHRSLRRPSGLGRPHMHTPLRFPDGAHAAGSAPSQPSTSATQGGGPLPSTLAVVVGMSPALAFAQPAAAGVAQAATPLAGGVPGLSTVGQHMLGSPNPLLPTGAAPALMSPPSGGLPQAAQQGPGDTQQVPQALAHAQASSPAQPPLAPPQLVQPAALAHLGISHQSGALQPAAADGLAQAAGPQAASEVPLASQGAMSVLSLIGNSSIQGHPLPLPVHGIGVHQLDATLAAAVQSVGHPAAAALQAAMQGGLLLPRPASAACGSPEPLHGGASGPSPTPPAPGHALPLEQQVQQPASSRIVAPPRPGGRQSAEGAAPKGEAAAAAAQQAGSIILGRRAGGDSGGYDEEPMPRADPQQKLDPLRPPEPQAAVIQDASGADAAAGSQQGPSAPRAGRLASTGAAHSTEGGVVVAAEDMEAVEDAALEVQQAAAPAAHGAASVMAAVVTQSGRSDGETEMQQTASGPSQPVGAEAQSPPPSAQPAAATAHTRSMQTAATNPSQHGPATSPRPAQHVPSSMATLSSGSAGERGGGSVGMSIPRIELEGATLARPNAVGSGQADAEMGAADDGAGDGVVPQAAASGPGAAPAPAAAPQQPHLHQQAASACQGPHQPPPLLADFAEHNPAGAAAMAQSSVALEAQQPTASACEGQNAAPAAPAKSPSQGAPGASQQAGPEVTSPMSSMHVAGPRGSDGTARGTIVAGAACSILTTAAAGDAEGGEGVEEALSPLQVVKAAALAAAAQAAANTGTVLATGAVSGSVDGLRLGISNALKTRSRAGRVAAAGGAPGSSDPPGGRPLPSTLAVEVDLLSSPQALASGQPSAAAAPAQQAQQGGDDGMEVVQVVAPPNGYAAHAHSMIGHGHATPGERHARAEPGAD